MADQSDAMRKVGYVVATVIVGCLLAVLIALTWAAVRAILP